MATGAFSRKNTAIHILGAVEIGWQWLCFSPPMDKQLLSQCGNRMAMALLLTTDEDAILSKLLFVRRSIGNSRQNEWANDVSDNPNNFEVKIK